MLYIVTPGIVTPHAVRPRLSVNMTSLHVLLSTGIISFYALRQG